LRSSASARSVVLLRLFSATRSHLNKRSKSWNSSSGLQVRFGDKILLCQVGLTKPSSKLSNRLATMRCSSPLYRWNGPIASTRCHRKLYTCSTDGQLATAGRKLSGAGLQSLPCSLHLAAGRRKKPDLDSWVGVGTIATLLPTEARLPLSGHARPIVSPRCREAIRSAAPRSRLRPVVAKPGVPGARLRYAGFHPGFAG